MDLAEAWPSSPEGVEVQMGRVLPTPTPQDIEAALTDIRDGTNVFARLVRFSNDLENQDEANAEADRLWWVDIIDPHGVDIFCGGGTSLAEAVAVAWISTCFLAWWSQPCLSDEDDAKVPRHVPEGWQFEFRTPVVPLFGTRKPRGAQICPF
jgi:hypothetical protein